MFCRAWKRAHKLGSAQLSNKVPQEPAVARFLREAYGGVSPTIAVTAAGRLPYYTRFAALDRLGLNDLWVAHHGAVSQSARFRYDNDYLLRQKPSFIQVNVSQ